MENQLLIPFRGLVKLSSFGEESIPPGGVIDFFECRMVEDPNKLISTNFVLPADKWMIQNSFWGAVQNQGYLLFDDWGREIYRSDSWRTSECRRIEW